MFATVVTAQPVNGTAAYSAGDLVGTKMAFSGAARHSFGGAGLVKSVLVSDLAKQNAQALELVLFDADPSGTTFTDGDALDVADGDLPKIVGVVPLGTADAVGYNDSAVYSVRNVNVAYSIASRTLYGALVARGTPTYASTADLQVRLGVETN